MTFGHQFLINRLFLSFFLINLISAWFLIEGRGGGGREGVDSSLDIKDIFIESDNELLMASKRIHRTL